MGTIIVIILTVLLIMWLDKMERAIENINDSLSDIEDKLFPEYDPPLGI